MSKPDGKISPSLLESVAGLTAGIASTVSLLATKILNVSMGSRLGLANIYVQLIAQPLDLIKTRLQVDRYASSSARIVQSVYQVEGIRGFYRGCSVNILGNSASWSVYFVLYGKLKHGIEASRGSLSYYDYFLASGIAGLLTALATNPIWVIKTRMLSRPWGHAGAYTSMVDGGRQIFQSDGFRGFYRGLMPSLLGVSHGALQFMAYEQLKMYRADGRPRGQRDLTALDFLVLSGVAKVFAGSATYPYQVVRTRLQMYDADHLYRSTREVMVRVWKEEGMGGFYKGLGPNLLRVLPSTWVTFLAYEKTKMYIPLVLKQRAGQGNE
ncbi:mitochondrial FAD carrier protein flx1 [Lecanora helva]